MDIDAIFGTNYTELVMSSPFSGTLAPFATDKDETAMKAK